MNLIEKMKSWKKEQILILLLGGVLLLILAMPSGESSFLNPEDTEETNAVSVEEETSQVSELENKLQKLLCQTQGVGQARVMIRLKSDGKRVLEKDSQISEQKEDREENGGKDSRIETSSDETTVYEKDAKGNETPFVTETYEPEILGVLVIAQGAGDPVVVKEITEAVMALFGIEAHKIKVMKML